MTRDEFDALPVLMSFFPLTFVTGKQRWTDIQVYCGDCNRAVPQDRVRGSVCGVPWGYRSSVSQHVIDAHALCPSCNCLTNARYVLHDDMSMTGIHPKTGVKSHWRPRLTNRWDRAKDWLWCKLKGV